MARGRTHFPLQYRRARTLLYVIALFWLWLSLGSAAFLAGLYHSPLHAALAIYALVVVVLVSIPAAALALIRMIMLRPTRGSAVVELTAAPPSPRGTDQWFGEKVS